MLDLFRENWGYSSFLWYVYVPVVLNGILLVVKKHSCGDRDDDLFIRDCTRNIYITHYTTTGRTYCLACFFLTIRPHKNIPPKKCINRVEIFAFKKNGRPLLDFHKDISIYFFYQTEKPLMLIAVWLRGSVGPLIIFLCMQNTQVIILCDLMVVAGSSLVEIF